jgi:hypothetical protein
MGAQAGEVGDLKGPGPFRSPTSFRDHVAFRYTSLIRVIGAVTFNAVG